jgi:hypothetical protein
VSLATKTLQSGDFARQGEPDDLFGAAAVDHAGAQRPAADRIYALERFAGTEDRISPGFGASPVCDPVDPAYDVLGQATRETR